MLKTLDQIANKANAASLDQTNPSGGSQPTISGDGTPVAKVVLNGYEQSRAKEQVS